MSSARRGGAISRHNRISSMSDPYVSGNGSRRSSRVFLNNDNFNTAE